MIYTFEINHGMCVTIVGFVFLLRDLQVLGLNDRNFEEGFLGEEEEKDKGKSTAAFLF